ncbi:MAG: hypothetical protein L0196_01475 [candidate division Zixibacteria bacterium]|nr:hypothetical protein [candidate division Zixibacteria bacterium]
MRNLLFVGLLSAAFAAFGCSSNPAGNISGPASSETSSEAAATGLYLPSPVPDGVPAGAQAFFGQISDLSASGFTLTSQSGESFDILVTPETQVLLLGTFSTDLSELEDGLWVTAYAQVRGMPGAAPLTAAVIVVPAANTYSKGNFGDPVVAP